MPEETYFHHIVRDVGDLERSERFYRDTLQLELIGRDLWQEGAPNLTFKATDNQYIVLVQADEVKPEEPAIHTNFMLSPEAFQRVYARLKEADCLGIDHRPERRMMGEVSAYFFDPDGHRFQMTAYTSEVFDVPAAKRGRVIAGPLSQFPVGSVTYIADAGFFLVRLQPGILAISEVCTHRHCTVEYRPEHYQFACPCHFNKYTRTGELVGHNLCPPLHVYAIEFVDEQIVVDTDTTIARSPEEVDRMVPVPEAVG